MVNKLLKEKTLLMKQAASTTNEAEKKKITTKKDILSDLIAAIKLEAVNQNCRDNITDDLTNAIILKELKKSKEALDTCPKTRADLYETYKFKYEVIAEYAPTILTDENKIIELINNCGVEIKKQNKGLIMKILKGKVDMKIATKVFDELTKE